MKLSATKVKQTNWVLKKSWDIFSGENDRPSEYRLLPISWDQKEYTNLSTRNGTKEKTQEKKKG